MTYLSKLQRFKITSLSPAKQNIKQLSLNIIIVNYYVLQSIQLLQFIYIWLPCITYLITVLDVLACLCISVAIISGLNICIFKLDTTYLETFLNTITLIKWLTDTYWDITAYYMWHSKNVKWTNQKFIQACIVIQTNWIRFVFGQPATSGTVISTSSVNQISM